MRRELTQRSWSSVTPWGRLLLLATGTGVPRGLVRLARALGGQTSALFGGAVAVPVDLRDPQELHHFLGLTERDVLDILETTLGPGQVFLDVGANFGFLSGFAAGLVGPSGRVIAVEPHPALAARLGRIAAANPLRNLEVLSAAASATPGLARLYLSSLHGRTSLLPEWTPRLHAGVVHVRTVTIDQLVEEFQLREIRLLKVDVEGHELDVLSGARASLRAGMIDVVVFEITPPDHPAFDRARLSDLLDLLVDAGYEIHGLGPNEYVTLQELRDDPRRLSPGYNVVAARTGIVLGGRRKA